MSGGVEDVQIWDCDLANSLSGIEIKATPKRGGYVRGVTVRDCTAPASCCTAYRTMTTVCPPVPRRSSSTASLSG